jgi:uncharacterized protein involved in response to NO
MGKFSPPDGRIALPFRCCSGTRRRGTPPELTDIPMAPSPSASASASTHFTAPVWRSAFRPFYLLGATYGTLFMLAWAGAYLGASAGYIVPLAPSLLLWHGHEIVFGFAAAIIAGIVLTALPSWAGTEEIKDSRLAFLVALWVAGRIAVWLSPWLPPLLVGVVDCVFFLAVAVMVTPQLLHIKNRLYLLLLPVLAGLFAANVAFHLGSAGFGLRLAIYSIMLLYALKGGVLVPIFTSNALRDLRRGQPIPFSRPLDTLAAASVVLLAAADLAALPPLWVGLAAGLACGVHALRLAHWRGWLVTDVPLLLAMHMGYAWLVAALGLKAAAQFTAAVPEGTWLHAFTVGALGMMMLGLMTRVALVHTGRPLIVPRAIVAAIVLMTLAAVLRVSATLLGLAPLVVVASAALWVAPFAIYLALFWWMLVRPSMPRKGS